MKYPQLIARYPLLSDQITPGRLAVVLEELEMILCGSTSGSIVEFGCYIGTTSVFIRRLLDAYNQTKSRSFYAYDSFAGLPTKSIQDVSIVGEGFKDGELSASKKQLLRNFQKAQLVPPTVIKTWFKDIKNDQLPQHIAYAFLDGDFYESIIDSLRLVWPRIAKGGTITVDDYAREALPGVTLAITDFFKRQPVKLRYTQNIAIIKKA